MQNEQIIEKIRRLLALSKSSNQNEALAAISAADKLITKYNIDTSLLSENKEEELIELPVYQSGRITRWKFDLCTVITKHYGCAPYQVHTYKPRKFTSLFAYGKKSNVELADYMYNVIVKICEELIKKFGKNKGHEFCNSIGIGFAQGVGFALANAQKEIRDEVAGDQEKVTALALISSESERVRNILLTKQNLKQVAMKSYSNVMADAYHFGFLNGKLVQVNKGLNQ